MTQKSPLCLGYFNLRDDDDKADISGTRYEIRKKYWEFAIPQIQAGFAKKNPYSRARPSTSNYLEGAIGIGDVYLCCVANFDESRIELYFGMPDREKNKSLYDYLHERKENIENSIGSELVWSRLDENKASKVYLLLKSVDVSNEADWPRMAKFHTEGSSKMYNAFKDLLDQYFRM